MCGRGCQKLTGEEIAAHRTMKLVQGAGHGLPNAVEESEIYEEIVDKYPYRDPSLSLLPLVPRLCVPS